MLNEYKGMTFLQGIVKEKIFYCRYKTEHTQNLLAVYTELGHGGWGGNKR